MTLDELRSELASVNVQIETLQAQSRVLRLAIEEAEGRGNEPEAIWLRAIATGDNETAERCYAEWMVREGDAMHRRSLDRARATLKGKAS